MKKTTKEITLNLLFILTGWMFWLFAYSYLSKPLSYGYEFNRLVITLFILLFLFVLSIALTENSKHWRLFWAVLVIPSIAISPEIFQILAAVILFLAGVYGQSKARDALLKRTGGYFIPLRSAFSLTTASLALLLTVSFYSLASSQSVDISTLVPKRVFYELIGYTDTLVANQIPGYESELTFEEYILLRAKNAGTSISKLTPEAKSDLISISIGELEKSLGIDISADSKLKDILYAGSVEVINSKLSKKTSNVTDNKSTRDYFPFVTSAILYLTLNAIFLPLRIIVLIVASAAIRLLVLIKIVSLKQIQTTIEYPSL